MQGWSDVARLALHAERFKQPAQVTGTAAVTVQIDLFADRQPRVEPLKLALDCGTTLDQRKLRVG
jgi:hypothetical protein